MKLVLWGVVFIGVWWGGQAAAAEWPQWRGPDGQGHSSAKDLPQQWSEKQNVAWRAEVPGKGWSSPVIAGNQIWLTTALETPASEEERKAQLEGNTNSQPLNTVAHVSLRAVCVARDSGRVLHNIELIRAESPEPIHVLNSFASPTPILEDGRLYCHFGANGTACLDTATGKLLWVNRELQLHHENGAGSSPVSWQDLLIVHCDGSDVQYIVALDKRSGNIAWKTSRSGEMNKNPQLKKAYGTPLIVAIDGQPLVLSPAADWLYAYDPTNGSEVWKVSYGVLGFSIVPRPVFGHGMLFLSTSFMQPELLAVRLVGEGAPEIAWRYPRQAPQMPSPLLVGDELYLVSDRGIATCLDARTGRVHWTERLAGNFSSSPLLADGRIYVSNRDGLTYVLAPGTKYQLLAENQLEGSIMATPAAVGRELYLRTEHALYRLERK